MVVDCNSNKLTKSYGNTTSNKAIKMEVVLKQERSKSLDREIEKQIKNPDKDQGSRFQESVQLCCVTMSAGPGTSFGDFQIPCGAKCSVCGAGLNKGRV